MDKKYREMVRYMEYIATNLDLSVSYSEYLKGFITKNKNFFSIDDFSAFSGETASTFKEFKLSSSKTDSNETTSN